MRLVQPRTNATNGRNRIPRERESGIRLTSRGEQPDGASLDGLRSIASATLAAAVGFEVCARRARTKDVATRMTKLAAKARELADAVSDLVPGGVRKPTTSERMRWEWLASTAALLDGGAEGRMADEANRHLAIAAMAAARLEDDVLADRVQALAAIGRSAA